MLSPRWRKVLADLWSNKTRTLLVVLSIAVGVFAIGMIAGARTIVLRDLTAGYLATNPASATLSTDLFDDELLQAVRRMPGVADADARRTLAVRVAAGPDTWKDLQLSAIADFDEQRINTVQPGSGAWPPGDRELLIERSTAAFLGAAIGDQLTIKAADGTLRTLRVAGVVHDPGAFPAGLAQLATGYVSLDTVAWLGEPRDFNRMSIVVENPDLDVEQIRVIAAQVQRKIEKSDRSVYGVEVPEPHKHPLDSIIQALILLLGVLGVFTLLLSGFLVVNTVGALLTQQTRQIGVMKAIGARRGALFGMYLVTVLLYGLLSILVAVPLGTLGARLFSDYLAGLFNITVSGYELTAEVIGLQLVTGLLVPLLAALVPVLVGTQISVREVIGGYGLGKGRFGRGLIDRLTEHVRFLSRPLLLALRNTFRRKGRLALTLTTLTLAGAIFIAVLSVRESVKRTLDDFFATYSADVLVLTSRPYRSATLNQARAVPGVAGSESWSSASARRLRVDGSESNSISVQALPAQTTVFKPTVISGRWLLPEDANAVVINTAFQQDEPDVRVGDTITLRLSGREAPWQVVGAEGILVGVISWALGSILALPLGRLLSDAVGIAFVQTPFSYTFSAAGVVIWLGLVIGLAALASFLPAWSAARVTIRDALAYE